MVIASQYGLIPYSSEWLPVSNDSSVSLPVRDQDFQWKSNPQLLHYDPYIPRPKTVKTADSVYTADRQLSSIGMPEIGALIDVYA